MIATYGPLLGVLVLAALAVWPVAITIPLALWEKRPVWTYAPLDRVDSDFRLPEFDPENPYAATLATRDATSPPLTPYAARATESASSGGFVPVGNFRHVKGGMYRLRYDFFLSPEKDVLALVTGGRIGAIPLNGTRLYSRLADGRCLRTIDTLICSELDCSGLTDEAVIPNIDFDELLARHRGRLATCFTRIACYDERDPLRDHRDYNVRLVNRLEEQGLIRFLDPGRNWWVYGLRGAVLWAMRAHFRGLRRAVWPDAWLKPGAGKPRNQALVDSRECRP